MIQTQGLTRHFGTKEGTVEAVRDLDLEVQEGELVALLGPNGAGKSTTMRMLTTLLTPTAGEARVVGHDVVAEPGEVRRGIGYVGQGNGAGQNQRVRDELVTQGRAYGLAKDESRRRSDDLLDALDLVALADRAAN
ncbi:MAG: ATP-binding cassette domain-containing protein, partial [Acidimicrobiales bacterium]